MTLMCNLKCLLESSFQLESDKTMQVSIDTMPPNVG